MLKIQVVKINKMGGSKKQGEEKKKRRWWGSKKAVENNTKNKVRVSKKQVVKKTRGWSNKQGQGVKKSG